MVQSPDGRGVLISGGMIRIPDASGKWLDLTDWTFDDKLYELRAGANSWNILNITLEKGRGGHAFIPLQ